MSYELSAFESTLKSVDTEEFIDLYFYRPIGYGWALFFRKIKVTPNQVTIASIFIGIAAGICFYFTDFWMNLFGVFLLIWANTYDSADGQLARMTHQKSALGRILDGACGAFWFAAIYIALVCRLWPEWHFWILILAFACGYSHSQQTAMADYYRNIHLLFLKGKNGSELDNSADLAKKYKLISWKKEPLMKFFAFMYLNYTKMQEARTPQMQGILDLIDTKFDGEAPDWFLQKYREKSFPLLKYTNMLSFNLRSIVLFISVLSGYPWVYFVFEITILNAMLIYMVKEYERFCRKLKTRLWM
jgi:hypothetical protein